MNVLLIQIRHPNDEMAMHEQTCLSRRVNGLDVDWSIKNVFGEQPSAEWLTDVSAMIVGGSGSYSVHDARSTPWVTPLRDVLELALGTGLPSFGICFGHQLLGYHLGATVKTEPELAEVGTIPIELTDEGANDPVFGAFAPRFCAHTGHSDSVIGVPERVTVLGRSSALETQIFKVEGAPFYSTQFHPDISGEEARRRYAAYQNGLVESIPVAIPEQGKRYQVGQDESNFLIPRFLEKLA